MEELSLMDMMKSFIQTQSATNEVFDKQCEELNERLSYISDKFDQGQRNHQNMMTDLERRCERISEKTDNQSFGKFSSNQEHKYQLPPNRNEQVNATSSWFDEECYESEDEEEVKTTPIVEPKTKITYPIDEYMPKVLFPQGLRQMEVEYQHQNIVGSSNKESKRQEKPVLTLLEKDEDLDFEQDVEMLERLLAYDSYPMEYVESIKDLPSDTKATDTLEKTFQQQDDQELDELERLLASEINDFNGVLPNGLDEEFDPDRDLQELEYLIANPGATLQDLVVENAAEAKFGQNSSCQQLMESHPVVLNSVQCLKSGVFEFLDKPTCLECSPSKGMSDLPGYLFSIIKCWERDKFVQDAMNDIFMEDYCKKEMCEHEAKSISQANMKYEKSDSDMDLLGIEFLLANSGATLVEGAVKNPENSGITQKESTWDASSVAQQQNFSFFANSFPSFTSELVEVHTPFIKSFKIELNEFLVHLKDLRFQGMYHNPVNLLILTCRDRDEFLQETHDSECDGYWHSIDGTHEAIKDYFEEVAKERECEFMHREGDNGSLRETKEWHDAWVKNCDALDVSNEALLFDDYFLARN